MSQVLPGAGGEDLLTRAMKFGEKVGDNLGPGSLDPIAPDVLVRFPAVPTAREWYTSAAWCAAFNRFVERLREEARRQYLPQGDAPQLA
jgi:hypothetical protein